MTSDRGISHSLIVLSWWDQFLATNCEDNILHVQSWEISCPVNSLILVLRAVWIICWRARILDPYLVWSLFPEPILCYFKACKFSVQMTPALVSDNVTGRMTFHCSPSYTKNESFCHQNLHLVLKNLRNDGWTSRCKSLFLEKDMDFLWIGGIEDWQILLLPSKTEKGISALTFSF